MTDPLVAVEGLVKRFYLKGQNYVGAINGISFEIGRERLSGSSGKADRARRRSAGVCSA